MKKSTVHLKRFSLLSLVFLFALGLGGTFLPGDAVAQVRPAYIKNVDEPGRQPYEYYIEFSRFSCSANCENFVEFDPVFLFDGPAVPAGKRLVIKHLSGRLPNALATGVTVGLQTSQIISLQNVKWAFFGPFFTSASMAGFSADAFATYGPGERPHFNVVLPDVNNFFGFINISGYLIDAN